MEKEKDYNQVLSLACRKKLNRQANMLKVCQAVDKDGQHIMYYRYVIGVGEKHFRLFQKDIESLIDEYPWIKKKQIRFVLNELIANSQLSMLREITRKAPLKEKVAGYFFLNIYISDKFVAAGIDEFGDYFDYQKYLETFRIADEIPLLFLDDDSVPQEVVSDLNDLANNKVKLVLKEDNTLVVPDGSNKIGLNIIEKATDYDFYVSSFYKDKKYQWKRIYFRIEND